MNKNKYTVELLNFKERRMVFDQIPENASTSAESKELSISQKDFFIRNLDQLSGLPKFSDNKEGVPPSEDYFVMWYLFNQLKGWPKDAGLLNKSSFISQISKLRNEDVIGQESIIGFDIKMHPNEKEQDRLEFQSFGLDFYKLEALKSYLVTNNQSTAFINYNIKLTDPIGTPSIDKEFEQKQARLDQIIQLITDGQNLYREFQSHCSTYKQYQEGMTYAIEYRRTMEIQATAKQSIQDRFAVATDAEKEKFKFLRSALMGTVQPKLGTEYQGELTDKTELLNITELRDQFYEFHTLTINHPIDPPPSNIMLAWIAFRSNPDLKRKFTDLTVNQKITSQWIEEHLYYNKTVRMPGFYCVSGNWYVTYYKEQFSTAPERTLIHSPILEPALAFADIIKYSNFNPSRTFLNADNIRRLQNYIAEAQEISDGLQLINQIIYETRGKSTEIVPAIDPSVIDIYDESLQTGYLSSLGFHMVNSEISAGNEDIVTITFTDDARNNYVYSYNSADSQQTLTTTFADTNKTATESVTGAFFDLVNDIDLSVITTQVAPETVTIATPETIKITETDKQKTFLTNRGFVVPGEPTLSDNQQTVTIAFIDASANTVYSYEYKADGSQTLTRTVGEESTSETSKAAKGQPFGILIPERAIANPTPETATNVPASGTETLNDITTKEAFIAYLNNPDLDIEQLKNLSADSLARFTDEMMQTTYNSSFEDIAIGYINNGTLSDKLDKKIFEGFTKDGILPLDTYINSITQSLLVANQFNNTAKSLDIYTVLSKKIYARSLDTLQNEAQTKGLGMRIADGNLNPEKQYFLYKEGGKVVFADSITKAVQEKREAEMNPADQAFLTAIQRVSGEGVTLQNVGEIASNVQQWITESDTLKDAFVSGDKTAIDAMMKANPEFAKSKEGRIISAIVEVAFILRFFAGMGLAHAKENSPLSQLYGIDGKGIERRLNPAIPPPKEIKLARLTESVEIDFNQPPYNNPKFKGQVQCPLEKVGEPGKEKEVIKDRITLKWKSDNTTYTDAENRINDTSTKSIPTDRTKTDPPDSLIMTLPAGAVLKGWKIEPATK